ncbi:MAG: WecB/TagA/CpsF family glycosyltransferase [Bacillota bacterium]
MRLELLGAVVDGLPMDEFERRVAEFVESGRPCRIITLNPEMLYSARHDRGLLDLVRGADLVTADGVGIVWACRMAGRPVPERVTGIDLMLRLLGRAAAEGWGVFLLGAAPGVAEEAARRLRQDYPGISIVGTHHGYFHADEEPEVVEKIRLAGPQLLFVAMGAPAQELFVARRLKSLGPVVAMGVGGSLDVISGRVQRVAPALQRLNLEWLGRLVREPARWRRMTVLPRFVLLVLRRYGLKRLRG